MKTIEEWFINHLPADVAEMAIRNTEYKEACRSSLGEAIVSAFVWDATPQGCVFWVQVFQQHAGSFEEQISARKSIKQTNTNQRRK